MKSIKLILILLVANTCLGQITKPIGINIASINDYSTELVFTDAFKQSRKWISSNAAGGGSWDTQIAIPLGANGYPLQIPYDDGINPPQIIKTLMLWDINSAVPVGQYRLKVTGNGQVKLSFGASGTYNCPIDTFVNVSGQVMLEILNSDSANPITDIKFIYPTYVNTYENQKYTTEFLNFLEDFQVIRFMDFTHTNGSTVVNWADRAKYNYYTQAQNEGAAWENVIEIANTTQKDIWINIPHKANDNYIQQLASLLQNSLNPTLKVYVEFSNEVWNGAFSQHNDCALMAQQYYSYTGQPWERAWKFTARRSADVFKIFEDTFTNDQRLIKIIPSQAANSWLSNQLVTFFNNPIYNPYQITASAIAIAPYFAGNVADQIITDGVENTITNAEILQRMQNAIPQSLQWINDTKTVANNNNLDLICYEGGQHLVATGTNINNNILTAKLIEANHSPSLQAIYCQYLTNWYANAGGLFCQFSSHGTYSRYGSWGVKENFQDTNNPKYLALQNCVFNANLLSETTIKQPENNYIFFPNPAENQITFLNKNAEEVYSIYDTTGRLMLSSKDIELNISHLQAGIYFISITNKFITLIKN